MIDETILLRELDAELERVEINYNRALEEDSDSDIYFYSAVCSALETTIKLIKRQPQIRPSEFINTAFGKLLVNIDGIDINSARIECKEVENEQ